MTDYSVNWSITEPDEFEAWRGAAPKHTSSRTSTETPFSHPGTPPAGSIRHERQSSIASNMSGITLSSLCERPSTRSATKQQQRNWLLLRRRQLPLRRFRRRKLFCCVQCFGDGSSAGNRYAESTLATSCCLSAVGSLHSSADRNYSSFALEKSSSDDKPNVYQTAKYCSKGQGRNKRH